MTKTSDLSAQAPLRIGILGAARIARKNVIAVLEEASGCVVTAIASRSEEKAKTFVRDYFHSSSSSKVGDVAIFSGENAYDQLVSSTDLVDALYIPLPTCMHREWVIKALNSAKHVIVEKPVALHANEFKEMLQVAYKNKKFLMDGTMYPHHNRTMDVLACVSDEDRIGKVDRIETSFSFLGDDDFFLNDIRVLKDGDPLGCLGDLGWYCVRLALLVFGKLGSSRALTAQVVDYRLNDAGVPICASCFVHFPENRLLAFHCGFTTPFRQSVDICGSKKILRMCDYVLPRAPPVSFELHSMNLTANDLITLDDKEVVESTVKAVQEVLMWETFARLARVIDASASRLTDESEWCLEYESQDGNEVNSLASISFHNQEILDALMLSIQKGGTKVEV